MPPDEFALPVMLDRMTCQAIAVLADSISGSVAKDGPRYAINRLAQLIELETGITWANSNISYDGDIKLEKLT